MAKRGSKMFSYVTIKCERGISFRSLLICRSRSPIRPRHNRQYQSSTQHKNSSSHTKKMSQAELEKRRQEMMMSAE